MSAGPILSQLWCSFWAQLVKLPQYLSQLFCGLLHRGQSGHGSRGPLSSTSAERAKELLFSPDELIPGGQLHKSTPYPLTPQQVENSIEAFIASINKSAICALASRHNGGKSCRIIDQRNGSFNICFFVLFDAEDVKWVVRIPIEPVISNTWAKVVSEITTIKYIKSKTTIPCPDVYGYGHEDTLTEGVSTPFMLMECLHGQQLSTRAVLHATETQRRNLYIDLIDTLAQLRQLEFPAAGSLIPKSESPDDESDPIIGPLLSMTVNEFERQREMPQATEVYTSMKDFIDLHSHILSETFQLPVQELEYRQAKMKIFALNSIAKEIRTYSELQEPSHSFVLAHPDLRCGNILVDDDFHILGIIDWEFTHTVPRQLLLPPPWITGHDPDTLLVITGVPRHQILQEFSRVLQEMHEASNGWTLLWQDWGFQQGIHLQVEGPLLRLSPVSQILRHPSSLMDVYYSSIFQRIFGSATCKDVVINDFFEDKENRELAMRVELQMQRSERYTDHLKSRGLFIADERSQQLQDVLTNLQILMQARQEGLEKKGKHSISSG
ncbi:phosphotransferase enzyme family protein [Metarhizium anisopliae]